MENLLKRGIYKHFKGGLYEVLFLGKNSENPSEDFAIYKSLENKQIWVRPLKMFFEEIKREGYEGPRFVWLRER